MKTVVIIGCGLTGIVTARFLAEHGYVVHLYERRDHIGGNVYDYIHSSGCLIQKYGPHSFFTNNEAILNYVKQYDEVIDSFVECETKINGTFYPMPFNFRSIDLLYDGDYAQRLKQDLLDEFKGKEIIFVTDLLNSKNSRIVHYGQFMYENEYRLYTAKQWGRGIDTISPEVFKRVPVYLSYRKPYQSHKFQFLPKKGFTELSRSILSHPNISYYLNTDALEKVTFTNESIRFEGYRESVPVLYTGAIDELFNYCYGQLPYRSLEFIIKELPVKSFQRTAIVAYPQAEKVTRVTEYTKLPMQDIGERTLVSFEVPFEYRKSEPFGNEPYYPVLTDSSKKLFSMYRKRSDRYKNLFLAGRLADFKYYNMDDVILRALDVATQIKNFVVT